MTRVRSQKGLPGGEEVRPGRWEGPEGWWSLYIWMGPPFGLASVLLCSGEASLRCRRRAASAVVCGFVCYREKSVKATSAGND